MRNDADDDIDDLSRQLERVRLQREEAQQAVERAENSERELIERIRVARRNNPRRRTNPHRIGDIVRITNTLRNEHGIVGTVISLPGRLVTIRNEETQNTYVRGWWNLELIHRPSADRAPRRTNNPQ